MCAKCEGEQFRGIRALFNGDLQRSSDFLDRAEWVVVSKEVVVHIGASALADHERPLLRGCGIYLAQIPDEIADHVIELSKKLSRPAFGIE